MRNEPDIRLIDTHPKGNCRHHDETVILEKAILVLRSCTALHAGVVKECLYSFSFKKRRQFLCLPPRAAVDDTALARMSTDELMKLTARVVFRSHRKA